MPQKACFIVAFSIEGVCTEMVLNQLYSYRCRTHCLGKQTVWAPDLYIREHTTLQPNIHTSNFCEKYMQTSKHAGIPFSWWFMFLGPSLHFRSSYREIIMDNSNSPAGENPVEGQGFGTFILIQYTFAQCVQINWANISSINVNSPNYTCCILTSITNFNHPLKGSLHRLERKKSGYLAALTISEIKERFGGP